MQGNEGTAQGGEGQNGTIDFGDAAPSHSLPPTVRERIALETHRLRIGVAAATLLTFCGVNAFVLYGVYLALTFDFMMLSAHTEPYERFVNTTVISSILGATTIQLGAIMFAIAKFLFPSR